jgi:hypothetical protein
MVSASLLLDSRTTPIERQTLFKRTAPYFATELLSSLFLGSFTFDCKWHREDRNADLWSLFHIRFVYEQTKWTLETVARRSAAWRVCDDVCVCLWYWVVNEWGGTKQSLQRLWFLESDKMNRILCSLQIIGASVVVEIKKTECRFYWSRGGYNKEGWRW